MSPTFDRSRALRQRAEGLFPGGVNSPVRAFGGVGGEPPFVVRGEGACLWDADGNRYIDYFGSWGPMILGHAFAPVVEAIREAAGRSASFGASTQTEGDLAELVRGCYPAVEKMRFVSSGTEATMSAIRLARAVTGRKIVVKFEGCYHGHSDGLLVKAGSGVATFGIPGSAGVPEEIARLTLALPYNDLAAVEAAFAAHPGQIACVIVEPVVGNAGCIPPQTGRVGVPEEVVAAMSPAGRKRFELAVGKSDYLAGLRAMTAREGALLIVDEVMTGFRLGLGGACEMYGLEPDLVTLGKIVGGGLPVGVFGGKRAIMDQLAPLGPVYQAGTLSGNPLAMAAGIATIGYLREHRDEVYPLLEKRSAQLAEGVSKAALAAGVFPLCLNKVGSMWTWFFTEGPVTDFASAAKSDTKRFAAFHQAMMQAGVWLPPSQFEAAFLSTAHTEEDIGQTLDAARQAFARVAAQR
ncbi:MAG TPA: glutamate-1-semialdehyde 2,1-aminomutase [Acidobacteriaceae bacterium]|jgi:glutamate-1-semialdehyde 2,1-aminomutase|nr:glutamate-1-semialdehyde 2,1-aminomutase [Acidobacteriaceae bacterium]